MGLKAAHEMEKQIALKKHQERIRTTPEPEPEPLPQPLPQTLPSNKGKGNEMIIRAEEGQTVTVQSMSPLMVAALRGLYQAFLSGCAGLLIALQISSTGSFHDYFIAFLIGALGAFAGRTTEAVPDTYRARKV